MLEEKANGEILNEEKKEYPLYFATLYRDKILIAKFSKRLSCAIKHLPIRVNLTMNTQHKKQ